MTLEKALKNSPFYSKNRFSTLCVNCILRISLDTTLKNFVATSFLKNQLQKFLLNAFFFFSLFILFVLFSASLSVSTTWIDAALSTDLKVVQNSTSNDTMYTASLDVSEGKLFLGATNSSYDLTSGLVGWWSFDKGNKTTDAKAWDYSGNNNHGALTNMNIGTDNCTGNCSGWTTNGNLSNGVYFDGLDDLAEGCFCFN